MKNTIRSLFWYLYDFLVYIIIQNRQKENSILLIRTDAIGDFVMWLSAARELRKLYAHKNLVLICNHIYADLAREQSCFDEVIELDRKAFIRKPIYRFNLLSMIRKRNFIRVIHPVFSREFLYGDSIIRTCGTKERIGSTGDISNSSQYEKKIANRWYTKLISIDSGTKMELKRNEEFIRGLDESRINYTAAVPRLEYARKTDWKKFLTKNYIKNGYFIIFPGASWPGKFWPTEKFADISKKISKHFNWIPVICGGPGDKELALKIKNIYTTEILDLTGQTSLPELSALIKNSNILISNDTSAVHMASALNSPCIVLLGGGHFGRFYPYQINKQYLSNQTLLPEIIHLGMDCFNCDWDCIYPIHEPYPCIGNIEVGKVWEKIVKLQKKLNN